VQNVNEFRHTFVGTAERITSETEYRLDACRDTTGVHIEI